MCVCLCMCVCECMCVCVCMCVFLCVSMHVCECVWMCFVCECVCVSVCVSGVCVVYVYVHVCMYMCVCFLGFPPPQAVEGRQPRWGEPTLLALAPLGAAIVTNLVLKPHAEACCFGLSFSIVAIASIC